MKKAKSQIIPQINKSTAAVWEAEDRLEGIMMSMRKTNGEEVKGCSEEECLSEEEVKEQTGEEEDIEEQFEKLQGAFEHQEM